MSQHEPEEHEPLTIQQVSHSLSVPKHTIRFWEKTFPDLVEPLRTVGGQRRYSDENVVVLTAIRNFRQKGLSLSQIKKRLTRGNSGTDEADEAVRIDLLARAVGQVLEAEASKMTAKG